MKAYITFLDSGLIMMTKEKKYIDSVIADADEHLHRSGIEKLENGGKIFFQPDDISYRVLSDLASKVLFGE